MRKLLLALFTALTIVLSFTACGSGNSMAWFNHDGYRCRIDYKACTVSVTDNNGEVVLIPFTITDNGGVYHCEVTFPDGKSYWEKSASTSSGGIGNSIFPEFGKGYGYSEGYISTEQIIAGDTLVDKIIENYIEVEQGTFSFPIGKILLAIAAGLIGLLQVCVPETVWFLNRGWRYKTAEPSELALAVNRICGGILILFAVIWLFV